MLDRSHTGSMTIGETNKRRFRDLCLLLALGVLLGPVLAETPDGAPSAVPLDLLEPPSAGKAVVYFFMPGKTPLIPSVPVFDNETQLPVLLGAREYFRYECDPGFHTFSVGAVAADTDQWVHGKLEAGGIYAALISNFMADLVIHPLNGRMHPKLLVGMKIEEKQWETIAGLIRARPSKPPGKERKSTRNLAVIAGAERRYPRAAFTELVRLNPPLSATAAPERPPLERLPAPVPGKSLVVFFVPEKRPDRSFTVFDGLSRLGPDLEAGSYHVYERAPGPAEFWVEEVKTAYTIFRLIRGDLEPSRVYGVWVADSAGNGGARLFGLTGNMQRDLYYFPEAEAWAAIESVWDSPGAKLGVSGTVDSARERKLVQKSLKKKSKKRHDSLIPLR